MIAVVLPTVMLAMQVPAPAASAVVRWSLQVAPARCSLSRQDPQAGTTVQLDTTVGSDAYRLSVAGSIVEGDVGSGPASLTFAPSQQAMRGTAHLTKAVDGARLIVVDALPPSVVDDLARAASLTIIGERGVKATVPLANTPAAVGALRRCTADQLIEWGADPAQFVAGGTLPVALSSRDDWVPDRQFVQLAGQSRRAVIRDDFRFAIDNEGIVSDCKAVEETTEPGVERIACAAVDGRRLYRPALDAAGKPVRGAATFRVVMIRRQG